MPSEGILFGLKVYTGCDVCCLAVDRRRRRRGGDARENSRRTYFFATKQNSKAHTTGGVFTYNVPGTHHGDVLWVGLTYTAAARSPHAPRTRAGKGVEQGHVRMGQG